MMASFRESKPTYASDEQFGEFNNTFNVYDETVTQIDSLTDSVTNADSDWGILGVLNGLILSAWQSLKLMITNWSFMAGVFLGFNTVFGVPAWIPALLVSAVAIMFVFALFSAFFQREL